jgi:DNA replication protein DnaC
VLLKTETDSRDSHGGEARIKAARFPARKTLEEFDYRRCCRRECWVGAREVDRAGV